MPAPNGPTAKSGIMNPGEVLHPDDSISSINENYRLTLQSDGNLVLYSAAKPLWASNTVGKPAAVCIMQGDGNLVLYDNVGHPFWASNTPGNAGAHLIVQDDGNVVIYRTDRTAAWATNSVQTTMTFDTGNMTSNLPLQGSAHLVITNAGDYTFSCHAHDSGFDNIHYILGAVLLANNGIAFTFAKSGGVEGTSAGLPFGTPRRDDNYTTSGNNPSIKNEWGNLAGAKFQGKIDGSDQLAAGLKGLVSDLVNEIVKEADQAVAKAIVTVVSGLV